MPAPPLGSLPAMVRAVRIECVPPTSGGGQAPLTAYRFSAPTSRQSVGEIPAAANSLTTSARTNGYTPVASAACNPIGTTDAPAVTLRAKNASHNAPHPYTTRSPASIATIDVTYRRSNPRSASVPTSQAAIGYAIRKPPVGPSRRIAPGGSTGDAANTGNPPIPASR